MKVDDFFDNLKWAELSRTRRNLTINIGKLLKVLSAFAHEIDDENSTDSISRGPVAELRAAALTYLVEATNEPTEPPPSATIVPLK